MKDLTGFPLTLSHIKMWMRDKWLKMAGEDQATINFINNLYEETDINSTVSEAPHMFFYFFDEKGIFVTIPVIITASGVEYSYLLLPRDSEKAPLKWWTNRKEAEKEAVMDACALYEASVIKKEMSL